MNTTFRKFLRPILVAGAVVAAAAAFVLPGSAGSAASNPVSVPITFGQMVVNGTTVSFPTVPGAALSGQYDADTGEFSGNLVIPAFTVSGQTSLSTAFTLGFAPVSSPVTGTILQSGTGSVSIGGWNVGILLPDNSITAQSDCSVTIASTTMATQFDPIEKILALTGPLTIPAATCGGFDPVVAPAGASSAAIVNNNLGLPTSNASYTLGSTDASALLPQPARPTFTG